MTSATLPSKTPILFPPRFCSIVVKTVRAAPAGAGPYCVTPVLILSMLEESRLIVVVLNQDRTPIDHNGLAGAVSFLHQKQIGLRDVMSFADSPHRQPLAHAFKELLPLC